MHEDLLKSELEDLRMRAKNEDFGVTPKLEDVFLARFLRVRKGNIEKALESLRAYYRNVALHRDFDGIRPSEFPEAFRSCIVAPLKERSNGRRVLIIRINIWDPSIIPLRALQVSAFFQAEYVSLEQLTQENGLILILDCNGISFSQARQLTIKEIYRSANAMQNGLPLRVCQIHFLNPPSGFKPIIKLLRTFVKKKILGRIHFHYSMATLQEHIHVSILPSCLGGLAEDGNSFDMDFIQNILNDNVSTQDFWKSDLNSATDEGTRKI